MRITPGNPGVINLYKSQSENNKNIRAGKTCAKQDRAEISPAGRELQTYRAALKQLPDVRHHRVKEIKERIQNGTYAPSAEKIAEGILREARLDTKV